MNKHVWVISGFLREAEENFALLGYDGFLPTFQNNLSAPSSGVKIVVPKRR